MAGKLNREQLQGVEQLNKIRRHPLCPHRKCAGEWCEYATQAAGDFLQTGETEAPEEFADCPPPTGVAVTTIIGMIQASGQKG